MRGKFRRHIDSRRAVTGTDNPDGDSIQLIKADQQRQPQGQKDAELAGRAEQEDFGVFQQRAEVRHCADADENEQGEKLVGYAHVVNGPQKSFLAHQAGQRDVNQDGPEADGDQQQRLDVLFDAKIQHQASDRNHHRVGPVHMLHAC